MAINYNINPYAVGNVVFDQRPSMAFTQQQLARKQAKEDALDNYFRDLGKNVTPAGMRHQDVPVLLQKQNEWQQFYQQNKSAILNPKIDNGRAYSEYMTRYQDQLGTIQESKDAMKTMDEVGKLRLNPQTSYVGDDPNFMDQIKRHELPIGDPNREAINIGLLALPPKPIDTKDREAHRKYLTGGLKADEIYGTTQNLPGFKTLTPVSSQYSKKNLQIIGQRGMDEYDTNRSWRIESGKLFDQMAHDPVLHNQLNSTFKSVYGKDIETPREARAAQDILDNSASSIEYKPGEDVFGREKAMEAIRFGHQKELKKVDQDAADSWIVNFWNNRIGDAKSGQPTLLPDVSSPLTYKAAYEIKPDAVMMKGLARNGIEPDRVYVTANNKILPVFFTYKKDYDEKGKKIGTSVKTDEAGNPEYDKELSKEMDLDQAYLSLGYKGQTKKQLGGTMQGTYKEAPKSEVKYPLPAGKPRTVKQGGHIYTWDETVGEYK